MPYADNLNVVGVDRQEVQEIKARIVKHLQSLGFRIHEEQDALPYAESLGFFLDGKRGKIFPKPAKVKKVQVVLDWLAKNPRVSGKMIGRAIGHCIHFCMLRRELLSVFRAVYDFKITHYSRRVRLWSTAAHECACMSALLDVCFADLRRPWCLEVSASDASLSGTATCAVVWPPEEVKAAGRQRELWRFRAEGSASKARDHVRSVVPFNDLESVKPIIEDNNPFDDFRLNLDFNEIPRHLLLEEGWVTWFASQMKHPEHITLLEGRGIVQALRHKSRSLKFFHCRHLHLNDNLGMVLSFDRGRAKDKALLFQCRRSAALSVAMDCEFHFRCFPSELNIPDSSIRGSCTPSVAKIPPIIQRLEKSRSRKKSSSNSLAFDSFDCQQHASTSTVDQCNDGVNHVRHLLPTFRASHVGKTRPHQHKNIGLGLVSQLEKKAEVMETSKMGVQDESMLLDSQEVPRLGKALMALSTKTQSPKMFPQDYFTFMKRWKEGFGADRTSRGFCSPISTWPCRRIVGSVQKISDSVGSKDERSLGIRQFNDKIRKKCASQSDFRVSSTADSKQKSSGSDKSAHSGPKTFGPTTLEKRRKLRTCLELFSGSSRVAKRFGALGYRAEAWDIMFGEECDLTKVSTLNSILHRISTGEIFYVHIGLPCNTWSRARRNDGRGPGPLRDDDNYLFGLPNLSSKDRQKVQQGNILLRRSIQIIRACQKHNVFWSFENPMTSRVWKVRALQQLRDSHYVRADFCQWNLPWRKSTYFFMHQALQLQFRVCTGSRVCSKSNKNHIFCFKAHAMDNS